MRYLTIGILVLLTAIVLIGGCTQKAPKLGEIPVAQPQTPATAPTGAGTSAKFDVAIAGFAFSPKDANVNAGMTVVWTNNDDAPHKIVADDGSFQSGNLAKGETFAHTFSTAGTYAYHCGIHTSMTGTVVVS
jgi:plastocyanin